VCSRSFDVRFEIRWHRREITPAMRRSAAASVAS
jgi:hypothetical protein